MDIRRVMVAINGAGESEHARAIGASLCAGSGAELITVAVRPPPRLRDHCPWCHPLASGAGPAVLTREGVPGIEIARCAEEWGADLVVLGRRERGDGTIGTTTEYVLRRRAGLTLLVPARVTRLRRVLFALDGSERGLGILDGGALLPTLDGTRTASLYAVPPDGPPDIRDAPPPPRVERVRRAMAARPDLGGAESLIIRRGEPVGTILSYLAEAEVDLLVLGLRRGAPGGDPGSGHVARDLLIAAPVAILSVPI